MSYHPQSRVGRYAIFAYKSRPPSIAVVVRNITSERERLANLLRQIRVDAGLRQVDLAEKLGLPQSYVSRFESAEQRLDLLELRAIGEALGVPLVEIVRRFERDG